ncbi:MAG: VWA domain-containing protein, partial [Promethearchaeota archaeon]
LNFIKKRYANEANMGGSSSFCLIITQGSSKKLLDFTPGSSFEIFDEALKNVITRGSSDLGEGIGKAVKILIEDIRTHGARIPHIIAFSDGKNTPGKLNIRKMATLAQQLGIKIDTLRIGDVEPVNILKTISEMTGGQYIHANNSQSVINATNSWAISNITSGKTEYGKGKEKISRIVLKKIAAPLLTEAQMKKGTGSQKELIDRIRGTKSYQKCSICFTSKDPISKTDFSISGRYCPNCGTPMHISCASQWAKNQDKEGDGTVFRCVRCFYLLKIPASVQTMVQMHKNVQREIKGGKNITHQSYNVGPQVAHELGEEALYSACPVCNSIFEETDRVIKCGNPDCNAIYHESCFSKLNTSICKVCGSKLIRLFQ